MNSPEKVRSPGSRGSREGRQRIKKSKKSTNISPFKLEECSIPTVWCGNGVVPQPTKKKRYTRTGTPFECLRKGFGAGTITERKKYLAGDSLQHIKYIGDVYENNFIRAGIRNTTELLDFARDVRVKDVQGLLQEVCRNKSGNIDARAYNSVILYLHKHGSHNLPSCIHIA
jgi:hypothetical protein